MANGTINLLGQNASVTIFIEKIFSRNDISSATIIIPYMVDVGGFGGIIHRGISKAEILLVKSELRTKDSSLKIGEGLSIVSYNLTSTQTTYNGDLQFTIAHDSIHKIEQHRKGDLPISLGLAIQAAKYYGDVVSGFDKGNGYVDFQIPQSYWVNNVLPGIGHKSFTLVELPTASQIIPAEYARSLNELEEARKYFIIGDYDKTVAHCRGAIDPFRAQKDQIKKYSKTRSEFSWINEVLEATDEWLTRMIKATFSVASKSHHAPSMGHFDRRDAEIVVMMTTAIVAYIGKLE